jgi:hypothetical protein
VARATALFDEVVVAIGTNSAKSSLFHAWRSASRCCASASPTCPPCGWKPTATSPSTLRRSQGARFLLRRGLRTGQDLDYERPIALINRHMDVHLGDGVFHHLRRTQPYLLDARARGDSVRAGCDGLGSGRDSAADPRQAKGRKFLSQSKFCLRSRCYN